MSFMEQRYFIEDIIVRILDAIYYSKEMTIGFLCITCFLFVVDCGTWASCQIRKIAGAHAPGMPGTFSPSPQVSDPDMHHGTCVTHVPWCMPGSLTSGFLWNRRRGEMFPAFPAHAHLQFYVSGKRPMGLRLRLGDVIMSASQITSLTIIYSTVYSDTDQRKHQSSASLAFVADEFPARMSSNAENVSIWCRHHA